MIRLRGYRIGEEFGVDARHDFWRDFRCKGWVLPVGPKLTLAGPDDAPLGVAGFQRVGDRQWCAWAFLAELAPRDWLRAARKARTCVRWAAALLDGGAEIYAVPADTIEARRLLAWIGFRPSPDADGPWKFVEALGGEAA